MRCILFIILALVTISCKNEYSKHKTFLNEKIAQIELSIIEEYDTIVVIPRTGCNSCIEHANRFFQEKERKNILFIFTGIYSRKQLELELGIQKINRENVILDMKNLMFSAAFEDSGYPLLMYRKQDNTFDYERLELSF